MSDKPKESPASGGALSAAAFASLIEESWESWGAGDGDRARAGARLIDEIRFWEELKSVAAARQARATAAFAATQREAQRDTQREKKRATEARATATGRGIGAQVALARRDSAHHGSRHLGVAEALVHEMPQTLAALEAGVISEWRATILVRETA